ncbi:hypothetical protein, partial [Thiomonas sp. UBA7699]|uniref:hypothetical protein n=1 Tax=Thiomonas sp. UBA7699 TaxID=1947694 RepID=UPI00257AF6A4
MSAWTGSLRADAAISAPAAAKRLSCSAMSAWQFPVRGKAGSEIDHIALFRALYPGVFEPCGKRVHAV